MPDPPIESPLDQTLQGETVVFTGKLWSFGRREARALVESLGGACDDDVTLRTTLVVAGAASYPDGPPDLAVLADDTATQQLKLRRIAQINAETPGRITLVSEDAFCRMAGQPSVAERRTQHYGQRDILAMYPELREDHLRYLQKWGLIQPAFRNNADTFYAFADLTLLRQVAGQLQRHGSFRAVLRDLQAERAGQLTFDFRLDAHPARILELKPAVPVASSATTGAVDPATGRPLSAAEQYFLMGSLLDDGSPERMDEAAQAYRRALEEDPDLVAALINLANIRYSKDELAEAQALYERAIAIDPLYFEARFNLGNIHHDHGQYPEAEAEYREALALNGSYADAHFYLAVTLEKMGRSTEARAYWKSYERLAPEGEWVELAKEFSD